MGMVPATGMGRDMGGADMTSKVTLWISNGNVALEVTLMKNNGIGDAGVQHQRSSC